MPMTQESTTSLKYNGGISVQPLSAREGGVAECLKVGLSNKQIARKLDIAEATVKVHVKSIL